VLLKAKSFADITVYTKLHLQCLVNAVVSMGRRNTQLEAALH